MGSQHESSVVRQAPSGFQAWRNDQMGTEIFNVVLNLFKTLPATGKPQGKEHTVLAGS